MTTITLSDLNDRLETQNSILDNIKSSSDKMSANLSAFVKSLTAFKGDEIEAEREVAPAAAAGAGGFLGAEAGTGLLGGLFGKLLPILAAVGGAILAGFNEFANDLARTFASLFVIDRFKRGIDAIRAIFAADGKFMKFLDDLRLNFLRFIGSVGEDGKRIVARTADGKWRQTYANMILDIPKNIGTLLNTIGDFLKTNILTGGFAMIAEEAGKLIDFILAPIKGGVRLVSQGIMDNLMPIFRFFGNLFSSAKTAIDFIADSGIGKLIGTLGTILKKIFFPIGLIFTAYDTVKGAIEGYEEGGVLGALGGAIKGLLASVVGAPLDLLRSGVAWILDKVGLTGAAEFLEGFNVTDIIGTAIESIPILFKSAVNGLLETVAKILEDSVIARGFADDVRALKFDIQKPDTSALEGTAAPDISGTAAADISAAALEDTSAGGQPTSTTIAPAGSRVTATGLRESTDEMNRLESAKGQAPVVIQDNSTKMGGSTTNQGIIMRTDPYDRRDPMMGTRWA